VIRTHQAGTLRKADAGTTGGDLDRFAVIVEVLVGLPHTLAGREGPSVTMAR